MKPQHFAVAAGFLVLTALVLIFSGRPQTTAGAAANAPTNLITVIGEGEVRAKPNLVRITLGVLTTDRASAADAEALNVASVGRVRDGLIAAGIAADSVEVSQPTIATVTDQDYTGATRISGFEARTKLIATMKYPGKVQAVIDAGVLAGATSLDEVVYLIDNPETVIQEAMTKALANARVRAAALANAGGTAVGDLISVEMIDEESPASANSPGALLFRTRLRASFDY